VKTGFRQLFRSLLCDESGQDLVEYALVAAMIGLGAVTTMRSFAGAVSLALSNLGSRLTASV
jgi:pilus assembly protein Flp/PilA